MYYRIINADTGIDMGTYEGKSEAAALDAMAQDAGYADYAEAIEVSGEASLSVVELLNAGSIDERLDGLEAATIDDEAGLRALLAAVDAGDEGAADALSEVQDNRLDGDDCGWRAVLADWMGE